jgi:uncharacterized protein (DUF433 family)
MIAPLIAIDEKGRAYVQGTRSRVSMIVCDTINGLSPSDIHREYPHLSLAQIHAALSYYYDHKAEVDSEIERELAYADAMREQAIVARTQPDWDELRRRLQQRGPAR